MSANADEPSLSEVLNALAEAGPHEAAARRLGLSPERLTAFLRESAHALSWKTPPPRKAAPTITTAPVAPPRETVPEAPTRPDRPPAASDRFRVLEIFSDGAARGNPGPAGAGAIVRLPSGQILARLGKFLGTQTNNVAEYEGLLLGLSKARQLGAREVHVFADSLLVISQLKGDWKIKHPGLKPFYEQARQMLAQFDRATLAHVRRELNGDADEMSNRAIDERMTGSEN
jgi:ribonuclease HI